jgi:aspartate aminotransferase-like enzyme
MLNERGRTMENKNMLMIPGHTQCRKQVLLAMAKAPIGHRTGAFSKVIAELTENLKWLHQTSGDVLMLTASGTGVMEAGIINFLSPEIEFWWGIMVNLGNVGGKLRKPTA